MKNILLSNTHFKRLKKLVKVLLAKSLRLQIYLMERFALLKLYLGVVEGLFIFYQVVSKAYFKNAQLEPTIFQSLQHPHIVKLIRVCENKNQIFMVMELMEGGSLGKYIQSRRHNHLNDEEAAQIMKYILSAVQYIHDQQIIHRDLKPENILLAKKNDLSSVRIADFGLSFQFAQEGQFQKLLTQPCGTILFMAPEQVSNQQYGKPVDLWSCGIIMYMLLSMGKHPLYKSDDNKETLIEKILNPSWEFSSNFSKLAIDFFLKLTTQQQGERYNIGQALIHPWITRRFNDEIPLTFIQRRNIFEKEQRMTLCLKALFLLIGLKNSNASTKKLEILYEQKAPIVIIEENRGLARKQNASQKQRITQRQNLHEMATPNKLNQLLNYQRSQSPVNEQLKNRGLVFIIYVYVMLISQAVDVVQIRRKTQLASPNVKILLANIEQRFGQKVIEIRQNEVPRLIRTQGSTQMMKQDGKKSIEKSLDQGNKKLPPIKSMKPKVVPARVQYYND